MCVYCKAEIVAEFEKYKDLVQGNFVDSYKNLTLKAVLGLRWMSQYCSEAPFAIKTDDDTFLNIFEMVRLMRENANKSQVRSTAQHVYHARAIRTTITCLSVRPFHVSALTKLS